MNIILLISSFLLTTYAVAMDSSSSPFFKNTEDLLMEVDGLIKAKKIQHKKLEFSVLAFCQKAYNASQELYGGFVQRFDELEDFLIKKEFGKTDSKEKELLGIFQNALGIAHYTLGSEFFSFDDSNNISQEFLKSATAFKKALSNGYDPSIQKNIDQALSKIIQCGHLSYYVIGQYDEASQIFKKAAELGSLHACVSYADSRLKLDEGDTKTPSKYREKRLDEIYGFLIKALKDGYEDIGEDESEKAKRKEKLLGVMLDYAKARLKLNDQSQERLDEVYGFLIKLQEGGYENIDKDEDEKAERKQTLAEAMSNLAYAYADLEKNNTKEQKFNSPNHVKIFSLCDMSVKKGDLAVLVNYAQFLLEYDFDREEATGFQKCQELLKKAQEEGYAESDIDSIDHFAKVSGNVKKCLDSYKKKTETQKEKTKKKDKKPLQAQPQPSFKKKPQPQLPVKKEPSLQEFLDKASKQIGVKDYPGAILAYEKGLAVFPNNPDLYEKLLDLYNTYKESLKEASLEKMKLFCREMLHNPVYQIKSLNCLVWGLEKENQHKEMVELLSAFQNNLSPSLLLSLYQSQKALGLKETFAVLDKAFEKMTDIPVTSDTSHNRYIVPWKLYADWVYGKFEESKAVDLLTALDAKDLFINHGDFHVDLKGFEGKKFYEDLLLKSMDDCKNLIALRCCEKIGLFLLGEFLKNDQEMGLSKISFETYQKHLRTLRTYEPLKGSPFPTRHLPYLAEQAKLHLGTKEGILFGEEWIGQGGHNDFKIIKDLANFYLKQAQESQENQEWITKVELLKTKIDENDWICEKLENYHLKKQMAVQNKKFDSLKAENERILEENSAQNNQIISFKEQVKNQYDYAMSLGGKLKTEKAQRETAEKEKKDLEEKNRQMTITIEEKNKQIETLQNQEQKNQILPLDEGLYKQNQSLKEQVWAYKNKIQQLEEALIYIVDGKFSLREWALYISPKIQQLNEVIYGLKQQLLDERDFWRGQSGKKSKEK